MTALTMDAPVRASEPERFEFAPFEVDKASVAALSPLEIARMTREELIVAILAAELPVLQSEGEERLRFLDRWTLERLVYLARHCCRNRGY